ncbi:MAG: ABC transporter permease [Synergistetes bacterium]|nr:ABC transporter permease [Synergistota bacterium]MCX8128148.1 ABC transporter permease [Synergistota bacterium]MDW8192524.1 ABC transporter permease [Synergistota bacterium]
MNKQRRDYFIYFFAAIGSFIIIYMVIPIIILFVKQITDLPMLFEILKDSLVIESLKNTLLTSTISTSLALLFGIPLGYVLARRDFKGKGVIQSIVDLPVVIPHSVVGIMLLLTFSEKIIDSYTGIIMVMFFVSASFVVNSTKDGFLGVDEKLEYVARTLGASKIKAFFTISVPIALPSIISGAIMAWARAISEVGAILIVAYHPKTAQVLVMEYFTNYGLRSSIPIAVLLMILSLIIFTTLRILIGRAKKIA